jgi:polyisoprenoid-binding protein YceI
MNTIKSILLLSTILFTGLSACNSSTQPKESSTGEAGKMESKDVFTVFTIDKLNSVVVWRGSDPAKSHTGAVAISTGDMKFDARGRLVGGSIIIDMNSIRVTDNIGDDKKLKLITHLKSTSFFAVDSFPTSKFEITNAEQKDGGGYLIKGNMTIRGTTLGLEIPATLSVKDGVANVKASFNLDRTKWGVNYQSNAVGQKLKDTFVSNMIELEVDITAKK